MNWKRGAAVLKLAIDVFLLGEGVAGAFGLLSIGAFGWFVVGISAGTLTRDIDAVFPSLKAARSL